MVDLKRNTINENSRIRIDLEIPRSAPNSSSDLEQINGRAIRASMPFQTTARVPGELSRPPSDSMLMKRRQNKSNTVTVLVIIGKFSVTVSTVQIVI
jgi:hypothetical protein